MSEPATAALARRGAAAPPSSVEVRTHKSATVRDEDGRDALELTAVDGLVTVAVLPRNGAKRKPVAIEALTKAVEALA